MKNFKNYRFIESVNGGQQWRCDYEDGSYALAVVYKARPTQQDVINAIDAINATNNQWEQ